MKKITIFYSLVIVTFILFVYLNIRTKEYQIKYNVDDYDINESFNKEENYYYFTLKNQSNSFDFNLEIPYRNKHQIINDVELIEEKDFSCIIPKIKDVKTYPLCTKDGEKISFHLLDKEIIGKYYEIDNNDRPIKKYKNIEIYNYLDLTYIFWNYKGFDIVSSQVEKEIKVSDYDIYIPKLVTIVNNNLIIPDYENEFTFDKLNVINLNNSKKTTWKLDNTIYFDSYIVGQKDVSVYLYDKHENIEYELVPHKKRMRTVSNKDQGKIYNNGWEDVSLNNLSMNQPKFTFFNKYSYKKVGDKLYLENSESGIKTLVSVDNQINIVNQKDATIFYLISDTLYAFNPYVGEIIIAKSFEWNFNSNNLIYVN